MPRTVFLSCLLGLLLTGTAVVGDNKPAPTPRTDANGDPLPEGVLARFGTLRLRHAGAVNSLVFSADGKHLVSCSTEDKTVRVWEVATGKLVARHAMEKESMPLTIACASGGIVFITAVNPTVCAWDSAKGRVLFSKQFTASGTALAVSADGKTLALGQDNGTTLLLDAATGAKQAGLPAPMGAGPVGRLIFTAGGTRLGVCEAGGKVHLWDVTRRQLLRSFPAEKGADGMFTDLAFTPDKVVGTSRIALATDEGIQHFDADSGKPVEKFEAVMTPVAGLRFSPDAKQILGIGTDGRFFRWDAATGKEVAATKRLLAEDSVDCAAFDHAAKTAAFAAGADIYLMDLGTGKLLHAPAGPRAPLLQVQFMGKEEVVCRGQSGAAIFWNPSTGKPTRPHIPYVVEEGDQAELSPDGQRLVIGKDEGEMRMLNAAQKELWKDEGSGLLSGLRFSPDGRWLSSGHMNAVIIRDAATGKQRLTLPTGGGESLAWSSDGRMLAVAVAEKESLTVWELATAQQRQHFDLKQPATSIALSRDGTRLVVGCESGVVRVFTLGVEKPPLELVAGEGPVERVAFAPDGSRLGAVVGDVVRVWTVEGKPLFTFRGHEGEVHDLAFSPDGRRLVSASEDGTALVWDLTAGPKVKEPPGKTQPTDLWEDLGSQDAAKAFRALTALRGNPMAAVALLKERLKPAKAPDPKHVARLLADLGSDDFATRNKAAEELESFDSLVERALRDAKEKKTDADVQMTLRTLIDKLESPASNPNRLREIRGVELLEQLGTREARDLLEVIAKGDDARLTRDARETLKRLEEN